MKFAAFIVKNLSQNRFKKTGVSLKLAFFIQAALALVLLTVLVSACAGEERAPRQAQLSMESQTYAPLVDTLPPTTPGLNNNSLDLPINGSPLPVIQVLITPPRAITYPAGTYSKYSSEPVAVTSGQYDVRYGNISAAKIEQIFTQYPASGNGPNPLTGKGNFFLQMGEKYGLNPAYAVAWVIKETSLGTTGIAPVSYNVFNITYSSTSNCSGSISKVGTDGKTRTFCAYTSLEEGIEAWFYRIRVYYVGGGLGRGNLVTVDQIVPVYAPASDNNDETLYISQVKNRIDQWGAAGAAVQR